MKNNRKQKLLVTQNNHALKHPCGADMLRDSAENVCYMATFKQYEFCLMMITSILRKRNILR